MRRGVHSERICGHNVFVPGHLRSVSRSDPRCSCGDKAFLSTLSVAVTRRCGLFRQLRIILFFFCSFVDFCHFSQEFTGKALPALYLSGVADTMELCDQRYPMTIFLPSTDKRCSWNWESNSTQKRETSLIINGPQRSAYALVLMQVLMYIGGNMGTSGRGAPHKFYLESSDEKTCAWLNLWNTAHVKILGFVLVEPKKENRKEKSPLFGIVWPRVFHTCLTMEDFFKITVS